MTRKLSRTVKSRFKWKIDCLGSTTTNIEFLLIDNVIVVRQKRQHRHAIGLVYLSDNLHKNDDDRLLV